MPRTINDSEIRITSTGAIVLAKGIAVDGYMDSSIVRVVTHIHSDHILGLEKDIKNRRSIVATPLTHDMLEILGYSMGPRQKIKLPYDIGYKVECGKLVLRRTNHIPGSCMVMLECSQGLYGYTSDFKLPGTFIPQEPDILVIDATYGRKEWRRPWQEEINELLVDAVLDGLSKGPVYLYGYNGKLEEVMILLRSRGVEAPFIVPFKTFLIAKTLEKHGYSLGMVYHEDDHRVHEIARDGWFIAFEHLYEWRRRRSIIRGYKKPTHILLTGWEFREPIRRLSENEWIISFSDHADFSQLVEYIEEARPKFVIVDSYRGRSGAEYFASYLVKKLNIPARTMPY
ncbi:MAG: MBL fold metallo-hydrolase [Pyrodictiaceae archaeon]